jgi:hypothetical protein
MTRLVSYPPSGGPSYAPNQRSWRYAPTGSAPPAWTPASLFAGGVTGFCLDGSPGASAFYEENTKVTLATSSGTDPVGAVTDVSGNGNDCLQSSSLARPVFYVDSGGIRSWMQGYISTGGRWLLPTVDVFASAAISLISVYKYVATSSNGSPIISNYDGDWGSGGYFIKRYITASPDDNLYFTASGSDATGTALNAAPLGQSGSSIIVRSGTGTGQTAMNTYELDGTLYTETTGTYAAIPTQRLAAGYAFAGLGSGQMQMAFLLVINKALSAQEQTDLKAYLVSKFSGWTP